jgi:hypothetical protein
VGGAAAARRPRRAGGNRRRAARPPRLLGAFEPLLLGWRSRKESLGQAEPRIVGGGIFRAFALVDGRAVALWRVGGTGPQLQPFGRLRAAAQTALERDYAAVVEFLGG